MVQTGTIDPVQHSTPARTQATRGRQGSNFAKTLGETNNISKNKIEPRATTERQSRAQNHDPLKHLHDSMPPRKADHARDHVRDKETEATSALRDQTPNEQTPSLTPDAKSNDATEVELPVGAEDKSVPRDDTTADEQKDAAADTSTEIPLPQQILNPENPENLPPPSLPQAVQQHASSDEGAGHKESEDATLEIDATAASSSKAAMSSHHIETPKPDGMDHAIEKNTESVTDNEAVDIDEPSKTNEHHVTASETEPHSSDYTEKSASKAETPKAATFYELGTQSSMGSGTHHAIHSHLAPDAAPTPTNLPPTVPDTPKANPVPYHALPIEIGLRALDGTKEITIDLTPKELGQLNIRISIDDQSAIQVSIVTEKPQTLALLQHDVSHIRHALEQAGYSTQDNSLQFSLQNNMSSNSNSSRDDQRKPSPRHAAQSDHESGELEATAPIRQRVHLNQLDLSI